MALAALSAETTAEFPEGWGIRTANDRAFATAGLPRTITYEVNDTTSLIDFVRHGLAVAMMPASLIDHRDGLALIPIRDHPTEFVTAVATPSNRRLSAAARALLETIERHVSSQRSRNAATGPAGPVARRRRVVLTTRIPLTARSAGRHARLADARRTTWPGAWLPDGRGGSE